MSRGEQQGEASSGPQRATRGPRVRIYHFDRYSMHLPTGELYRLGRLVHMEPQNFEVLEYLIRHRDRIVTHEELLQHIWCGRALSPGVVNQCIFHVRRALGDSSTASRFIRTYARRGYRFIAPLVRD